MRWRLTTQITKWFHQLKSTTRIEQSNTNLHQNHINLSIMRFRLANYMPIIRLMLLAIAIILSYQAHQTFTERNSANGFIFLSIAAILFVLATWTASPKIQNVSTLQIEQARPHGWQQKLGIVWLVVSGILLWQAAQLFLVLQPKEIPTNRPWQYFATGIILLIIVAYSLTPTVPRRFQFNPLTIILFIFVISLALFLRLYLFDKLPYGLWFDEAINGLQAREMLNNPDYRPTFIDNMTQVHLWLYKIALGWFGETSIMALRSTSVAFGVGSVAAGFFVGQELRGPWFGFFMAFFLAIMSWAINFSRIAMTGIETGFFTLLAFFFLLRVLRYGYWRDALWLGLAIGFGLWFYSAFRFVIVALGLFALLNIRQWKRRTLFLGTFSALMAIIILFPLIIYINNNTDTFLYRSRQINILDAENRTSQRLIDGLKYNTETHLQMFHLRGDWNGRHNLPYEPMLDPIMGILLIFGVAVSVRNFRQTEEWFFILLFIVTLLPGVLTIEFEAPQALRTIGVLPAIAYFCALSVFMLAKFLAQSQITKPLLVGIVILLGASLVSNYQNYFEKRRHDYYTWESFSAIETALGNIANEYPDNTRLFFSPLIAYPATTEFIAPAIVSRQESIVLPDVFPLRISADAPAVVFLHYTDEWLWEYAHTIYPNATFRIERASDYGVNQPDDQIIYYIIELSADDILSVQGLEEDGTGILYVPEYGIYNLNASNGISISIDGKLIESNQQAVELSIGNHIITTNPASDKLEWRILRNREFEPIPEYYLYHSPVAARGLEGSFYGNDSWQGDPKFKRIDPTLDIYFHHVPLQRPYSVIWSGWLQIPEDGNYDLQLIAVEHAELLIDGEFVLVTPAADTPTTMTLRLIPRIYTIEVRYLDTTSYSKIELSWKIPGSNHYESIPPQNLSPYRN